MRQFKFRAFAYGEQMITEGGFIQIHGQGQYHVFIEQDAQWIDKDCVIMQFTGLLDKNGKEIYEWDVREGTWLCDNEEVTVRNVMVWDCLNACFYWEGSEIPDWADKGVIGNRYENPDLLP